MKVPLFFCAVMLSAISTSAQCTHQPVGQPLRVDLIVEDNTPIVVQNAFMNGLRSIPDVVVKTGVSSESEDVVVQVRGLENEDRGHAVGETWKWDVYRYWYCGTPASPFTVYQNRRAFSIRTRMLKESFDGGLSTASLSDAESSVRENVATINAQAFEKLRQERDASRR
jgi:hypothetical protein